MGVTPKQMYELKSLCVFVKKQPRERVNLLQAAMTPFKVFCQGAFLVLPTHLIASRSVVFQLAAVICHIAGPDRK